MLKLVLSVALLAVLGDAANIRTWSSRIVGGVDSASGEWPWQVSLRIEYFWGGFSDHICGGSLIDESHVLTAAHCVEGSPYGGYAVIMGVHNQNDFGIFRSVSKVTIHDGYNRNAPGIPNDIAILQLNYPVDFTELVIPVNPPQASDVFMGKECYITGWGVTTEGSGSPLPDILQKARMEVISNESCKKTWENSILDSHICIDGADKSACNGDSGGPLVCNISGRWVLAGITSWGRSGCIANDFPNVYTRVTSYLNWISDK